MLSPTVGVGGIQEKGENKNVPGKVQLCQSWKRKQSLAIFQTGCSLFGVACAVSRKFWLKKRCLFPSNLTTPQLTTNIVVWPWVACSVNRKKLTKKHLQAVDCALKKHLQAVDTVYTQNECQSECYHYEMDNYSVN